MNYYEALGLTREATAEQIKRAYFKLLRQHPPESDPEGFQRIQQAYQVLSDPDARQAYDRESQDDGRTALMRARVEEALERGAYEEALHGLKAILLMAPSDPDAHNLLGLCYMNLEKWDAAVEALERGTAYAEKHPALWRNLGISCLHKSDLFPPDVPTRHELLRRAVAVFLRTAELVPYDAEALFLAARTSYLLRDFDKALEYAEKSVMTDGQADTQDFEALFLMCAVCLEQWNDGGFELSVRRLRNAVPAENEALQFAAERFMNLAATLASEEKFSLAGKAATVAISFFGKEKNYAQFRDLLAVLEKVKAELYEMNRDPAMPDEIRVLFENAYQSYLTRDPGVSEQISDALYLISQSPPRELKQVIKRLRENYPSICALVPEAIKALTNILRHRSPDAQPSNSGIGINMIWVVAMAILIVVRVINSDLETTKRRHRPSQQPAYATMPPSRPSGGSGYVPASGYSGSSASSYDQSSAMSHGGMSGSYQPPTVQGIPTPYIPGTSMPGARSTGYSGNNQHSAIPSAYQPPQPPGVSDFNSPGSIHHAPQPGYRQPGYQPGPSGPVPIFGGGPYSSGGGFSGAPGML